MARTYVHEVVQALLAAHGIPSECVRSKHFKVSWKIGDGRRRTYTCSVSQSEPRTLKNVRADVRRLLREDGISDA
jgi:hypothetical protein